MSGYKTIDEFKQLPENANCSRRDQEVDSTDVTPKSKSTESPALKSPASMITASCTFCGKTDQTASSPTKCPMCKSADYCGRICQNADWINHRRVCSARANKTATTNASVEPMEGKRSSSNEYVQKSNPQNDTLKQDFFICNVCNHIGAHIKRCSQCRSVGYCSIGCQKTDWKKHKLVCERKSTVTPAVSATAKKCKVCGQPGQYIRKCSRCKNVDYCGVVCQKTDWKEHKLVCERKSTGTSLTSAVSAPEKECNVCGQTGQHLRKCSRCKNVDYCGIACQKDDWQNHKLVCVTQSINTLSTVNLRRKTSPGSVKTCNTCCQPVVNPKRCSNCKTVYCGITCQKADWTHHKQVCTTKAGTTTPEASENKSTEADRKGSIAASTGRIDTVHTVSDGVKNTPTEPIDIQDGSGTATKHAYSEDYSAFGSAPRNKSTGKMDSETGQRTGLCDDPTSSLLENIEAESNLSRRFIPKYQLACNVCKQVGTQIKRCTQCQVVGYCCVTCQKADWKNHKRDCIRRSEKLSATSEKQIFSTCLFCSEVGKLRMCSRCKSVSFCNSCSSCCYCSKQRQDQIIRNEPSVDTKYHANDSNRRLGGNKDEDDSGKPLVNSATITSNYDHWTGKYTVSTERAGPIDTPPQHFISSDLGLSAYNEMQTRAYHMFPHMTVIVQLNRVSYIPSYGYVLVMRISHLDKYVYRHGAILQDRKGRRTVMYFHNEDDPEPYFRWSDIVPGNYICHTHPQLHNFRDGQTGFRIDECDRVRILSP